jgi:hypothetical protein
MRKKLIASLAFSALALCATALAGEKRSPQGQVDDESVSISATVLSAEQLKQAVGSDFDNNYTALEVRVSPKGGKPYLLHLDDFILRSEATGEHGGPFLAASQIAGAGALEVERTYGHKQNVDSPAPIESTKVKMKDDVKQDPALAALKQQMLTESTIASPVSGLLIFPLSKEKPKNLVLSCKTPSGKLRLTFK